MTRLSLFAAFLTFALLAGCDSGSSTATTADETLPATVSPTPGSTTSNGGTPVAGAKVDPRVVGTWRGIPGTGSSEDTVRITSDSLVSTWTYSDQTTTHAWSLYPVKFSGAWFYATAGIGGKAGCMGITNGQTVRDNVTYEYMLSQDTLFLELQGSDIYDTIVDRASLNTHALVRAN